MGCGAADTLLCHNCQRDLYRPISRRFVKGPLRVVIGASDYHAPLARELIIQFKYQGYTSAAEPLAQLMIRALRQNARLKEPVVFVPIPADFWRRMERGYHQTELVAKALSRDTGYPVAPHLKKIKPTPSQTELSRGERTRNLRGLFAWRGPALNDTTVILVDDVTTTGATIAEAAKALKAAAPREIYGLVWAIDR